MILQAVEFPVDNWEIYGLQNLLDVKAIISSTISRQSAFLDVLIFEEGSRAVSMQGGGAGGKNGFCVKA